MTPEAFARLSATERDLVLDAMPQDDPALVEAVATLRDDGYRREPWRWLCQQVVTKDEATNSVRPWPDKPYIRDLVQALDECPMLGIPKTRRMFATWATAAWLTHRVRYGLATAAFWQSENEDKSAFAVDQRCHFIESSLRDPLLRRPVHVVRTAKSMIGRMTYRRGHPRESYIWAVPASSSAGRTYTPSVWVLDEIEFQENAWLTFEAALPFTEKGGRLILISTSNGPSGVLAMLCKEVGFTRFR